MSLTEISKMPSSSLFHSVNSISKIFNVSSVEKSGKSEEESQKG
jgi:hypothetical protein